MYTHRIISISATVAVVAAMAGCGGSQKTAGPQPTSTTTVTSAETRNEIAQLQRERDEARIALAEERSTHQRDLQRDATEAATRHERDELETRVLDAVQSADDEMHRIRTEAMRFDMKQKKEIDEALKDAQAQRSKLYADLHRLQGEVGASWETFRADVDSTLRDLDRSLATASEVGQKKGTMPKGTMPKEMKPKVTPKNPGDTMQMPMKK